MSNTRFETGDIVASPDGRGVVAAVLTTDFQFPQPGGEDQYADVSARNDRPAYVVGLEGSGSAVYRASTLETSSFDEDSPGPSTGESETKIVTEDVSGLDDLPEGWDHESVLEYWSTIGGSWEECIADTPDDWSDEQRKQHCAALKDTVLQTSRWRNRF